MNNELEPNICILGLGNLMRTDDAVGMLAVQALEQDAGLPDGVRFVEGGTLGLDLLSRLDGVTHLLALDAVDTSATPGTLVRFAGEQIHHLPVSKSAHLLGFSDLIGVLTLMDLAPKELVLLGVQPKFVGWGTELTTVVDAVFPLLLEAARLQVREWKNPPRTMQHTAQKAPLLHA